jgi:hypothetical protein
VNQVTKKKEDRTYKLQTAKVANLRLVSSRPVPALRNAASVEEAREIILRLIEAIKRL